MIDRGFNSMVELEDKAGVERDRVRHFLKGHTKSLSSSNTQKICAALGISVYEFLGAGPSGKSAVHSVFKAENVQTSPPNEHAIGSISIEVPASFGLPGSADQGGWLLVGDSAMSPSIAKGDFVWAEWVSTFEGAGIYLVRGNGKSATTLLRRVAPHGIAGKVDVSADNPRHRSETNIAPSALKFLGRVGFVIKKI